MLKHYIKKPIPLKTTAQPIDYHIKAKVSVTNIFNDELIRKKVNEIKQNDIIDNNDLLKKVEDIRTIVQN